MDLGRSTSFSAAVWGEQTLCPILRSDSFRRNIEDVKLVRELFAAGRGHLFDEEGIDWWDLASLLIEQEVEEALVLRRLVSQIGPDAELWTTRPGWLAGELARLLQRPLQSFFLGPVTRAARKVGHYAGLARRFTTPQMKQIFLDKYDGGYRWRARFAPRRKKLLEDVVLLPSAYENVSRMAASYARLLPEQSFLLVATRQSAREFQPPPNVHVRDLASYATVAPPPEEISSILERWKKLESELGALPEFDLLSSSGVFKAFPAWFHDCLYARNAWREVLQRESVIGVLCGDDSNIYTRLPVLLAARRGLATVDFHHGAMDGRYLLKDLPCDTYLAKSEMERDYLLRVCGLPSTRVVDGAPAPRSPRSMSSGTAHSRSPSIVFFSEPYEGAGFRAEEIYRELLPPLCRLARQNGRGVILKLHPFESPGGRLRMLRSFLPREDWKLLTIVDAPLSDELLAQTWFGVTIESTTVMDCSAAGVPCFVCEWLAFSPFEYMRQYARFGIGRSLRSAAEIAHIPRLLEESGLRAGMPDGLWTAIEPRRLQQLLTARPPAISVAE